MKNEITKQMEMVLYRTEEDDVTISALIKDESIWITQKAMAELFGVDKSGISRHLSKIFETGELEESLVVAKIATPNPHGRTEGTTQYTPTNYYNLNAIITVGYRVNSKQATKFRIRKYLNLKKLNASSTSVQLYLSNPPFYLPKRTVQLFQGRCDCLWLFRYY